MDKHLILVAKSPFGTDVKSRLAKDIGQAPAKGVYARLLYHTIFTLLVNPPSDVHITLSMASAEGKAFFVEAFPELQVTHQCQGNIGKRIGDAIQKSFTNGAKQTVLISTDQPGIPWGIINIAFQQINQETIVLGPSKDGGFYLVGMAAPGADIFHSISWSTEKVLTQTLKNIHDLGLNSELLKTMQDIDRGEDWESWKQVHTNNKPDKD